MFNSWKFVTKVLVFCMFVSAYNVCQTYCFAAQTIDTVSAKWTKVNPVTKNQDQAFDISVASPTHLKFVVAVVDGKNKDNTYLTVCNNYSEGGLKNKNAFTYKNYSLDGIMHEKDSIIFNPQFSPDGRYVFFEYGQGYLWSPCHLLVLDTLTDHITVLKPEPTNIAVSWSPDGTYLTYISGGSQSGDPYIDGEYYGPLSLHVMNWLTGEDHVIVTSDSIINSYDWLDSQTLIYAVLTQDDRKKRALIERGNIKDKNGVYSQPVADQIAGIQPNVYEYSFVSHESKLLFKDGYQPKVSSNGKYIAFFGSENPQKPIALKYGWQIRPTGASLIASDIEGKSRKPLNLIMSYPDVVWERDNQHILILTPQIKESGNHYQIDEYDKNSGKIRHVMNLSPILTANTSYSVDAAFTPSGFSTDGKHLYILEEDRQESNLSGKNSILKRIIRVVSLNDGTDQIVVSLNEKRDAPHAWYFEMDWQLNFKPNM